MKQNNELINEDLEILDFKNNSLRTPLEESDESSDPNSIGYKINSNVKTREELLSSDILLSVRNLKQFFFFGKGFKKSKLKAVNNISFDIHKGECFGVVGESGCGKTTTGRSLIRLYDITSGAVYYKGYRVSAGTRWNEKEIKYQKINCNKYVLERKKQLEEEIALLNVDLSDYQTKITDLKSKCASDILDRQNSTKKVITEQKAKIKQIKFDNKHVNKRLLTEIQMIFQDPVDSLDPRMTVGDIIAEGLLIQGYKNKAENFKKVVAMLEKVGLVGEHASRYPHEFSGGQRQRIGIARALIMNPKLLICDEPISALDVSIRAQVINLLNDLKEEYGLTMMFIAHDLSVVKYFCDRIAVMYAGKIVEIASSEELFRNPLHPYTKSLLSAIPKPDPISEKARIRTPYNPMISHDYSVEKPDLKEVIPGHEVYCNEIELAKYKQEVIDNAKKAKDAEKVADKPKVEPKVQNEDVTEKKAEPKTQSSTVKKVTKTTTTTTKKVVKKEE